MILILKNFDRKPPKAKFIKSKINRTKSSCNGHWPTTMESEVQHIYDLKKKRENRPTLTPMPPPVLPAWPPHLQGGHHTRWRDNDHNDNMDTLVRHWNIIWDILRCIYILCTVWCNQMGTFFAEMSYWKASKCHAGMKTVF